MTFALKIDKPERDGYPAITYWWMGFGGLLGGWTCSRVRVRRYPSHETALVAAGEIREMPIGCDPANVVAIEVPAEEPDPLAYFHAVNGEHHARLNPDFGRRSRYMWDPRDPA